MLEDKENNPETEAGKTFTGKVSDFIKFEQCCEHKEEKLITHLQKNTQFKSYSCINTFPSPSIGVTLQDSGTKQRKKVDYVHIQ